MEVVVMANEIQDQAAANIEQQQQSNADAANVTAQAPEPDQLDASKLGFDELDSVVVDDDNRIIRKNQPEEPEDVDADGEAAKAGSAAEGAQEESPDAPEGVDGADERADLGTEAGKEDAGADEKEAGTDAEPEVTHDPLIDTKRALTKAQQKLAEYKKRLAAIEQEKVDSKKPDFGEDDILSDAEIEALQEEEGAEAVVEYYRDLNKYNSWKAENQRFLVQQQQNAQEEIARVQDNEVLTFLKAEKGWDLSTHEAEINEWYEKSPDFKRLAAFVSDPDNGFAPDRSGVYKASALRNAWRILNLDAVKQQVKKEARAETVNAIKSAQNGGSKFDKVPAAGGSKIPKSLENMTQKEIAALSEEQVMQMSKDD
jgi:hypothetical protein